MTNHVQEIQALAEKFTADVAKVLRKATKADRHAKHPAEPEGASLVKVYFDGDRDGNSFAICHPTGEYLRVKRDGGRRERAQMWKYSYETSTGTANKRSWIGMLKTLDGHGRTATRVEVFRPSGMESVDLT
jgi:hypothetical protein